MEQEEITKIYETLAPMAGEYLNAQAEQIGQAQSSMGPLANAVKGQSQTAGLGNYTYNRLMRPQVDTMRDEIMVKGYTNQLNRLLSDALSSARKNYIRKTGGGGGGSASASATSGGATWDGSINAEGIDSKKVEPRENKNYQLMWVVDPSGNRTQWKVNKNAYNIPVSFDNPDISYGLSSGMNRLKELAGKGYKITDYDGNDITSRYK